MQNPAPAGCAYDTATDAQLVANCNPWANRRAGGLLDPVGPAGRQLDLYLRTWTGTSPNLILGAPTLLNAAVSQAAYSADGFRGEAAVDLTATVFGGSTACKTFANTIPSTVTGNSDTADYKDTILETTPPITNCSSTTVTTPQTGAGAAIPAGGVLDRDRSGRGQGLGRRRRRGWHRHPGGLGRLLPLQGRFAGTVHDRRDIGRLDGPHRCGLSRNGACPRRRTSRRLVGTAGAPPSPATRPTAFRWATRRREAECFTVIPVTPGAATPKRVRHQPRRHCVSDSATLTGAGDPAGEPRHQPDRERGRCAGAGGTITFTLYGPGNCTTVAYESPAVSG